jgi:hypothetical protein
MHENGVASRGTIDVQERAPGEQFAPKDLEGEQSPGRRGPRAPAYGV